MSSAEELDLDPPPTRDPLLGALIDGRFRVMAPIGEGGMGKVYEALHEGLGRVVAIKVLGAAWASDEATILRFQREARTASNIGHHAIVDVSDLGRLDDGRPYLVMERLRGQSFADLLDEHGRLPPDRVAHLVNEVASALDAVHARGIVHRDIKPENLIAIRGEDGGPEQVKLLDFGLAAFALPSAENARLTRHGQMHGTPHYMAPESGDEAMPDYRADVYSLAVVAYELLTGFVPFDSKNPLQILTRKMHEDPPTIQDRSGLEFSEDVEQVMARGLARLPDDRPMSAGEFARDLAEAIRSLPDDKLLISGTHPRVADPRGAEFETQGHSRPLPLISSKPPPPLVDTPPAGNARARMWKGLAAGAVVLLAAVGGLVYMTTGDGAASVPAPAATASVPAAESGPSDDLAPTAPRFEVAAADTAHDDEAAEGSEAADEAPEGSEEHGAEAEASKGASEENTKATRPQRRARRARRRPEPAPAPKPEAQPPSPKASPSAPRRTEPKEAPPSLASSDRERSKQLSRQGTSALVQGRLPEAISLFRDATMAHTGNAVAWRGLGLANERLGRRPEAIQAYQRYLRIAPGAGDADSVRQRVANLGGSP
jgi:eukaryotic-like serine/threonine-protein kinase